MSLQDKELNNILEQALADIREETVDPGVVQGAADRVWARIAAEVAPKSQLFSVIKGGSIGTLADRQPGSGEDKPNRVTSLHGCADFQALIPAYLEMLRSEDREGSQDPRFLLLEDHTHACVSCRKALQAARAGIEAAPPTQKVSRGLMIPFPKMKWVWAMAAALLMGVGLSQIGLLKDIFLGSGPLASVQEVDGALYQVTQDGVFPLSRNAVLHEGQTIRTAKASGAMIRLADGSLVEMSSRAELSLSRSWQGTTIQLDRGDVIVQAAKQRARRLYLSTPDCRVSVTGTVFAVNQGIKGARVSVVEGEVRVEQGKQRTVLHSGQQLTTSPNLTSTSVDSEIAWSRNTSIYSALLHELKAVNEQLDRAGLTPGLRHSSRLLNLIPAETAIFAAIPNLSRTLAEGRRLLEERINQNEGLRQWREEMLRASHGGPDIEEVIEKVRAFGDCLGEEVVLSVPVDRAGQYQDFLLLAEVTRQADFPSFLRGEVEKLNAVAHGKAVMRIVDNPAAFFQSQEKNTHQIMLLYYSDGVLAMSPSAAQLQQLATRFTQPGDSGFSGTEFYSRLSECYRNGAGWLFGLDMNRMIPQEPQRAGRPHKGQPDQEMMARMGLFNLKHLIVEHKENHGRTENLAALSFGEARQGIMSWLAAPGPMGSLNFVSPDANLLSAFVVKNPASLVDDLFSILSNSDPSFQQHLEEFQTEHNVNVREDIAAPLGGEFAFALDGPVLPKPSWKMIVEVNDAARLQHTLEWAIQEINNRLVQSSKPRLRLDQQKAGARTFYTLGFPDSGIEAHYLFLDGYLVAAPSRALLEQTIQFRDSGYTLPRSAAFAKLLPQDGRADFSALVYQNMAPLLRPLAGMAGNVGPSLAPEQKKAIETLVADAPPTLIYAYGEDRQIVVASTGDLSYFGLNLGSLMHLGGALQRAEGHK